MRSCFQTTSNQEIVGIDLSQVLHCVTELSPTTLTHITKVAFTHDRACENERRGAKNMTLHKWRAKQLIGGHIYNDSR